MDCRNVVSFQPPPKGLSVVGRQLMAASKIIEDAAYALAGSVAAEQLAELVMMAAKVERMANALHNGALLARQAKGQHG